jgi:hypothetical protein
MLASVRSNGIAMRANTEATIREETKARPPTSIRDHEVSFLKPGTATPPPADSEEKHEPASDIDTMAVDSLKALDPKRPIREADIASVGDEQISSAHSRRSHAHSQPSPSVFSSSMVLASAIQSSIVIPG